MNFMKGFSDKIPKRFDKKSEPNGDDCEDHSLTVDNGINDLVNEFEDCVDLRDNDIEVNANGLNESVDDSSDSSDDNHFFMANQRMGEEFVSKREAKQSTDWYELQTMETQSKCSSSGQTVMVSKPAPNKTSLTITTTNTMSRSLTITAITAATLTPSVVSTPSPPPLTHFMKGTCLSTDTTGPITARPKPSPTPMEDQPMDWEVGKCVSEGVSENSARAVGVNANSERTAGVTANSAQAVSVNANSAQIAGVSANNARAVGMSANGELTESVRKNSERCAADYGRAPECAADYGRAPECAADYGRAPECAADYGRAPECAADFVRAPECAADFRQLTYIWNVRQIVLQLTQDSHLDHFFQDEYSAIDCNASVSHVNELNSVNGENMEIDNGITIIANDSMEESMDTSTEKELWVHNYNEERKRKRKEKIVKGRERKDLMKQTLKESKDCLRIEKDDQIEHKMKLMNYDKLTEILFR
ncbi:unnamed protein product [Medioppia subpectinata]|uniref:Uncharacterized protein n=1 Tax=Medioppia subpectinata TaxID=1979941 RepID=A0A7R9KPQ3_9ACAR|nr:unnamed protein product [Medioppia subpectinata]CAG2107394.1 unnamed protein product [Medioppia subpectinata]